MTTKDTERKALAQIRKIVEGLGKDSYIGTAFEGCFDVAEQNIENDFACSYKQEIESLEKRIEAQAKDIEQLMHLKDHLTTQLDGMEKRYKERAFMAQEMANRKAEAEDLCEKLQKENDKLMDDSKCYEDEIIRLKAKLYDLMVK